MTIGEFIQHRRIDLGLTLEDIGNATGVTKSTVKKWETGFISNMGRDKINLLAKILQVSPIVLLDSDVADYEKAISKRLRFEKELPSNIIPLKKARYIPVVGKIACGTPILAVENITDNILLPDYVKADFALICEGDSMINVKIDDGDTVFIKQQSIVENGEIAAVLINDEVTLKKVYFSNKILKLVSANDKYEPFVYAAGEINDIRILGKAVAVLKNIK